MLTSSDEPPYDRNGSVMPLAGMMSSTTDVLIRAWKPNREDSAIAR